MKLLALESSTERLSLAVQNGDQSWTTDVAGGAQSSAHLIPYIMDLMAQAQLALTDLNAIAFGRGPGAFTGLRTACAVAQGLALGANVPVLPIDTLLCIAQTARATSDRVWVLMDARMQQIYAAAYEWHDNQWHCLQDPHLAMPSELSVPATWTGRSMAMAGNALASADLREEMQTLITPQMQTLEIWPQATALLNLAAIAWRRGQALAPELALPVYVRDQVALTTAQRQAIKAHAS